MILKLEKLFFIWRNEQSRQVIIQIFVLAATFFSIFWLISNVIANFAILNKGFGYDFLFIKAGYDINLTLIEYSNESTHFRAAIVGLLNTCLVAIIGIILATIIGVFLGILRLSNNWLLRNLSYSFIEFTRNVPVLLHILLWHGIIINTLPHPKKAISIGDFAFLANRGFYVPKPIAEIGFEFVYLSIIIGIIISIFIFRYFKKRQETTGQQFPVLIVNIGILLFLPILTFVMLGFPMSLEIPSLKGFNYRGGMHLSPELVALTYALGIYTAAFIAEIVRSGILAIDKGQREAAESLGLKANKVMKLIILPQARRIIIPPLTSQYLNLTKNSSLAIAIGYMDLIATLGGITLNQTGREMETMILVMAIYLTLSLSISFIMNWYNKKSKLIEK